MLAADGDGAFSIAERITGAFVTIGPTGCRTGIRASGTVSPVPHGRKARAQAAAILTTRTDA